MNIIVNIVDSYLNIDKVSGNMKKNVVKKMF